MNYLKLTDDRLDVEALTQLATSPICGAISIFVGTTRDNFDNKTVIKLEYEAYESMAVKALEKICAEIRHQWTDVQNIVVYHRLGAVPVKEASIVIAISSPHRKDAIQATEWCIDNVKKSVPIWKKEIYADGAPEWKANRESKSTKQLKLDVTPPIQVNPIPHHLIQIKATNDEINKRIENFMDRKRNEINQANIREFCPLNRDSEFTCARVDAILRKRHDSKGHLQVNRVLNSYCRDQTNSDYLTKHIPPNGIEERLHNLELQLSLTMPTPKDVYVRLKKLEDRMLYLESISPEYINFWDRNNTIDKPVKKKIYTLEEIDAFITELEQKK